MGQRVDKPEEERMEGELISMLGEAKNVNNTLEEEIK
jgi:hypothetical protein